jgi:hypothetical protein
MTAPTGKSMLLRLLNHLLRGRYVLLPCHAAAQSPAPERVRQDLLLDAIDVAV